MLQMSEKMWCAPLPAEPLRLEKALLEVRGSPDRIRKAHSVCSDILFLPCLAAATPPCTPRTNTLPARVPYLPSHLQLPTVLLYLTPGRLFSNFFGSSISLKHWKATSEKPGSGCLPPVLAAACSILCQALPLGRSPGAAPATPAPAHLHMGSSERSVDQRLCSTCQHSQSARDPQTLTPVTELPYTALGRNHQKIFYLMFVFMIMHDKCSQRYIFSP